MAFSMENVVNALGDKARTKPRKLQYSELDEVLMHEPTSTPMMNEMMVEATRAAPRKERNEAIQEKHDVLLNVRDALYNNQQS